MTEIPKNYGKYQINIENMGGSSRIDKEGFRLDDYVKQVAETELVENRVKFLDQQLVNAYGFQTELKADLEKALNRANCVCIRITIY